MNREYRVTASLPNRRFDLIWICTPDELVNKLTTITSMIQNTGVYVTHAYEIDISVSDKGPAGEVKQ